jgi:hypothetical protein
VPVVSAARPDAARPDQVTGSSSTFKTALCPSNPARGERRVMRAPAPLTPSDCGGHRASSRNLRPFQVMCAVSPFASLLTNPSCRSFTPSRSVLRRSPTLATRQSATRSSWSVCPTESRTHQGTSQTCWMCRATSPARPQLCYAVSLSLPTWTSGAGLSRDFSGRAARMTHRPLHDAEEPSPEDPSRFREGEISPLDEAPDGLTPSDPNDASEDSLPPGAH